MEQPEQRVRVIREIFVEDTNAGLSDGQLESFWYVRRKAVTIAFVILLIALMVGLRLIALDSDAYPRLSWSSALLTDEGFYMHNARNLVLFGKARTDGFNNMLIMPTLHLVQIAVFRILGVGAIQARLISVFASLLTLPIFYVSLLKIFGRRVAVVATLFLGLDHTNLLYSRMALMDTPASALLICAFYAFTRALPDGAFPSKDTQSPQRRQSNKNIFIWTLACGILLGLTYATRGLTALVIPSFLFGLWVAVCRLPESVRTQRIGTFLLGLCLALLVFLVLWYLPNRAEIVRVNRYYVGDLLAPHSLQNLKRNLQIGLFDYQRGMMPYLLRHSPIQFGLAVVCTGWVLFSNAGRRIGRGRIPREGVALPMRAVLWLCTLWLLTFGLFLCCVNYAPSRYYVLFYPALAVLSSFALFEVPRIGGEIIERKILMAILGSFLICLGAQAARSRLALIEAKDLNALFYGLALALCIGSLLHRKRQPGAPTKIVDSTGQPEIWVTSLVLWALVNGYWTGDWLKHLTYRQRDADSWLARSLPSGSTLFGAVAPGLCMNNRFKTVNVIENLSNDSHPLDDFAAPRYIVILDDDWKEMWWKRHYPNYVAPERRIHCFRGLLRPFFVIGLYSVDTSGR